MNIFRPKYDLIYKKQNEYNHSMLIFYLVYFNFFFLDNLGISYYLNYFSFMNNFFIFINVIYYGKH